MTDPIAFFKSHNLKATAPRLAILAALTGRHIPASAQDICAKLPKKSGIDLVTVYRTLASFEKAGIVRRIDLRTDSALYELADHHHHHIVCTSCGIVEDFESCGIEVAAARIAEESRNFTLVRDHSLELFGICNACCK